MNHRDKCQQFNSKDLVKISSQNGKQVYFYQRNKKICYILYLRICKGSGMYYTIVRRVEMNAPCKGAVRINKNRLLGLFRGFRHKRVGKSHKLVDNNERNTKASTKSEDLLTNGITKGSGTMGFLVQNFGHRSIGNNIAGSLYKLTVQVTNNVGVNI